MGKTVAKIISAVALVAAFVVPGGQIFIGLAGSTSAIGFSITSLLLTVSAVSASIGFAPEIPGLESDRHLAANLSIQSTPNAVRAIPFGRVGIAGQVLFRENIEGSGDTPDEILMVLALAGYPATALEKFWLNGELVFDGDSTTGPGAITTGKFADDLWVWFRTGEETSEAFSAIDSLSSGWNAKNRTLRGIPAIGLRIKVTEELEGRLEPLAQFKGAKLYDPRLDSTVPGGSGSHDFDDQSTWAWSENPKLGELLYLRGGTVAGTYIFGMRKSSSAIDLENFASEANICEEQIDVVGGGSIDRYTMNGLLIPQDAHRQNLHQLLSASGGTMDASTGVYRTFAAAWRAPSGDPLTEEDIDGAPTNMQMQIDPGEEINIVQGVFADPIDAWQVKEYPPKIDSTSIALIGERSETLDLPFTTDHRIAQRLAKIHMLRKNAARQFSARYWLKALSFQPGDIVDQTYSRYGFASETFRVNYWGLESSEDRKGQRTLRVVMQLVEEQETWFAWDETTEEQQTTSITSPPSMDNRPKLITLDGVPTFAGASPPANPKVGWLWRDTGNNVLYRWSGSAWSEVAIGSGVTTGQIDIDAVTESVIAENATDTDLALIFSGAYGTVGSANFTVPSGETYRLSIEYTVWADIGAAGSSPAGNFRALVNSSQIQEIRGFNTDMASQQHQFSWTHVDDFAAGSHTASIEGRATSGTATKLYATVKITVLKR